MRVAYFSSGILVYFPSGATTHPLAFEWQYLSSRTTLVGTTVDPASVAHVSVNVPTGRSVALTGHIHNLFNARYADPASAEQRGDSIEQNGRTLRVGFRWSFWNTK